MRYALFILAAILLALTPTAALAADPRSGSNVTIDRNEVINDDLYVTGGTLNIMGTVNGDVVAAGGTVDVSGSVTGDVIAAGGTINISGQVGESVRTTGGTVTISGPVDGDGNRPSRRPHDLPHLPRDVDCTSGRYDIPRHGAGDVHRAARGDHVAVDCAHDVKGPAGHIQVVVNDLIPVYRHVAARARVGCQRRGRGQRQQYRRQDE